MSWFAPSIGARLLTSFLTKFDEINITSVEELPLVGLDATWVKLCSIANWNNTPSAPAVCSPRAPAN